MTRVGILVLLSFTLIFTFNSCQKEEYKNPNLKLIVNDPVNTGDTTWLFSGKIITSGKIELFNHGFEATAGSNPVRFDLGTLNKGGAIEFSTTLPMGVIPSDVVFYATDYDGNVYSSNGLNKEVPVIITNPQHTSDLSYEYFSATINNSAPGSYVVFDYGIDYRLATSSVYTQGFQFQLPGDNYSMVIPAYRQIEGTSGTFISAQNYIFRFYAMVRKLSDGTVTKVYSSEGTFTAIAL